MLQSLQGVRGYSLRAEGREFGEVVDFLVDGEARMVRFLVAKTRRMLPGRTVAISSADAHAPDWRRNNVPIALSKAEAKQGVPVAELLQQRVESGGGLRRSPARAERVSVEEIAGVRMVRAREAVSAALMDRADRGVLYRLGTLTDFRLHSRADGPVGRVVDLVFDDQNWMIHSIVVELDTPARRVLVPMEAVDDIGCSGRVFTTRLGRSGIAGAPEEKPAERESGEVVYDALYDQDGRPRMWFR